MDYRKLLLLLVIFGTLLLPSLVVAAEMPNNLANEACITCHQNYPGLKTGIQSYDVRHKFTNCITCHTSSVVEWMWNCRYCHLTAYQGSSGFKSYSGPLKGNLLGTGEFMDDHEYRSFVDSGWVKHTLNMSSKHLSKFPDSGCSSCHQNSIAAEHEGKTKVVNDPNEGFETPNTIFSFTGDWVKTTKSPHAGFNCLKNQAISHNNSSSTQFTITVDTQASFSFWYRVSTESGYDKLFFYIDGEEKLGGKSGNIGWTLASYALTPGTHTLRWTYKKDASATANEDSVYIDDVILTGVSFASKFDCNTCHLSTNTTVKNAIKLYKDTRCTACHNTSDHGSDHTAPIDAACLECHSPSLDKEHSSRLDGSGKPYNCDTCHSTANTRVVTAIKERNKNCSACHDAIDHESIHLTKLDGNCKSCHSSTISQDHIKNPLFTGYSYNCNTCHTSTVNQVIRTVKNNNLNCGGCHSYGHGLALADTVPIDIPLYSDVKWTSPKSAGFFAAESGAPLGYELGQVVLSNRDSKLSVTKIFDYYNQQLVVNGWKLISAAPRSTDNNLSVEFEKNSRRLTLKTFNTLSRTGTGEQLDAGYKIEIWYK